MSFLKPLSVCIRGGQTKYIRALVPESVRLQTIDGETTPPAQTDIFICGRPSAEDIEASSNLRLLIIPYAGVPEATRHLMLEYPCIAVHNLHHNAAAAAELAVALFLAAAKRLIPADRLLRKGDWSIRYTDAGDLQLEGKRALILGFGAIGKRIARACRGLGMIPVAVRRRENSARGRAEDGTSIHSVPELHELLASADALFVATPLTDETRGMLGTPELDQLPRHAVLVNIARGPIVDEKALYDALAGGSIAAAGLDVWYNYPRESSERTSTYPSTFPFHELEQVVLSPHRGGAYNRPELEKARARHLAQLLNAAARGEKIPNRVDLQAGY